MTAIGSSSRAGWFVVELHGAGRRGGRHRAEVAIRVDRGRGPARRGSPSVGAGSTSVGGDRDRGRCCRAGRGRSLGGVEPTRQRQLLTDAVVVVATAAWPLALASEVAGGGYAWPTGWQRVAEVAAGVLGLLAVLGWRRRHPVAVALVVLPLSASPFAVVPAFVALYELAARRERHLAVGAAVAYVAVAIGVGLLSAPAGQLDPGIWFAVLFHAIPVALGMVRHARTALVAELRDRAARAETEQQLRVEQARRLERQRIAREMHDVVAHRISLVSLHAGALAYRPDAAPDEVARAAEVIRASAHEALEELRGVIHVLREVDESADPELPQPTLADVPALFERCRAAGTRLVVHDRTGDVASVPPLVARTAYRVLEEALTNAAKHAPHAPVEVTVDGRREDGLLVEVVNAVPVASRARSGEPAIPGSGSGLIGLAERVAVAGGVLQHGTTADGRFRVRAEVPWTS
ncbi:sensor histidine kinase [Nitriliruptoraceae bacterium ZYF776]|nr:sensor histidine kinase [Profundirhabdus halotolerans]